MDNKIFDIDYSNKYNYYISRNENYPSNDSDLLSKTDIITIIENETLYKTFEDIKDKYTYDATNFRETIKDNFILKNEDALKFLKSANWACQYTIIQKQTLVPVDSVNYYVINYLNKVNDELTYNNFIVAVRIENEKIPTEFREIFTQPEPKISVENNYFIRLLKTEIKYDNELFNKNISVQDE
jgi:hypothetical protein